METIDPDSISTELLERDDETEAVQVVPPVVAVLVTTDAGPWFEEGLAALGAQDYPSLSVLVLDNGSAEDPTDRIASALPGAFVRRCAGDGGFAAAANDALASVEGAVFLLFCHDDVVLDPDAARLMVEEAYRSNAGIVGPKVVDRDNPDILLEVGMSVDHYGVPFSGLEPGEVDQEQHDGVRDVFYVSHAAMLVRADLFHELGGFDPATFPGADDIDLCWRARLAGARVIVAPSARVRHGRVTPIDAPALVSVRNRTGAELRDEVRARVRLIVKSYSALALVWVLPVAFLLNVFEALGLLVTGRVAQARGVVSGWISVFTHPGELRRARRDAQRLRRIDDGDVRDLMIRGSARLRRFMLERVHAGDRLAEVTTRTRVGMDNAKRQLRRLPAIIVALLTVLVLFGSRSLLSGRIPQVGAFQAWPAVGDAWSTFTGSWRTTMMGSPHPATPVFALMAALSAVLFGHPGLAQSLVIGGAIPIGAIGAYRLLRGFSSSALPGIAAAAAYAANPIARNAIWQGELGPLVCFALAPFVLGAFVRATGDGPAEHSRLHVVCGVVLLVAIAGSVWAPAPLLVPAIAVAFVLALPFVGGARHLRCMVGGGLVASVAGVVLLAPWSFSLIGADAAALGAQPRSSLSFLSVLGFHTGRAGGGFAPYGILAAAVVPLAIATGPRLVWATCAWVLAAISFVVAWVPGRLTDGATVFSPNGVLVAAAIGLAFAAGLGVSAVLDDLRRFHFGWRQVMMIVAFTGLALAAVGFSADTLSGRFGLKADDWPSTYSWMSDNPPAGGFRVLWVGDPNVLPADAKVTGDVGFALTRDGVGDARASWAAPEDHADRVLAGMIDAASSKSTVRLGHLLAPVGVRYIVFVQRAAPKGGVRGRDETAIGDALARQLDLTLSRVDTSGVVYDNDAWFPMHAVVPPDSTTVQIDGRDPRAAAVRSESDGVVGAPSSGDTTNAVGPGTLLWSEAANSSWGATTNGHALARRDAFAWTNAFALDSSGPTPVKVHFSGNGALGLLRFAEVVIWILVAGVWFVTRRRRVEVAETEVSETQGAETEGAETGLPASRSRRFLFVILVVALVVGALAAGRAKSAPAVAPASVTVGPNAAVLSESSTVWFCPGLPPVLPKSAGRVTLANIGDTDADIDITNLADNGKPTHATVTVKANSVVTKTRTDLGPPGALTVETFGGRVLVEEGIEGPHALESTSCATQTSAHWYFAAGTTPRGVQEWLVIDNPYASDARVDVTLRTSSGVRKPDALQGVDVPRRSRAVFPIHDIAVRQDRVAVEIDATIGSVVANQSIVYTATAGTPGVALALGSPTTATEWTFVGGAAFPNSSSLVAIANVGDGDAQVDVQATAQSKKQTLAPTSLTVPQDNVVFVTLGHCPAGAATPCINVPQGVRYSLDVRAEQNVSIVAQTLTRLEDAPDAVGTQTSPGGIVPARAWAFARSNVSAEQRTTLSLYNPGAVAVTFDVGLAHDGQVDHPKALRLVSVPPGRAVTVTVAGGRKPSTTDAAITINVSGPIFVERSILASDEAASSVGVVVG